MSNKIQLGIIGTGFGGRVHLPAYRAIPGVRVVGVAGLDTVRTKRFADENRIERAYPSWEALVADPEISAVSVATPPACCKEIVLAAAMRRKAVFCEKPLGLTPEEARQMLFAVESSGVTHMVDFMFRFSPERIKLKELLSSDAIGRVLRANVEWTLRGRADRSSVWSWQFDVSQGGGVLYNFGSHVADYVEWLLGPIGSVSATLTARKSPSFPDRTVAEDTLDLFFQLEDGTPVSVSVSTAVSGGRGHWLSIYGEKGALVVGNPNLNDIVFGTKLYRTGPEGNDPEPIPVQPLVGGAESDGRLALVTEVMKTFVQSVQSGVSAPPNFRDGLRAQQIIQAVRESHQTNRSVRIEPMLDENFSSRL